MTMSMTHELYFQSDILQIGDRPSKLYGLCYMAGEWLITAAGIVPFAILSQLMIQYSNEMSMAQPMATVQNV